MKKHILHKSCAVLSAACLCASLFSPLTAFAAENAYIEDGELSDVQVEAPAKDDVLPDANQYRYQKMSCLLSAISGPTHSMKLNGARITEAELPLRFSVSPMTLMRTLTSKS